MDKDILVVIAELLRKQDKMMEIMNGFMGQTSKQLNSHNNILEKQNATLEELKNLAVRQQDYNEMFYNELKLTSGKIDTLDKKFDNFTKPDN